MFALPAHSSVTGDSSIDKELAAENEDVDERGMDRITRLWWQGTRFKNDESSKDSDVEEFNHKSRFKEVEDPKDSASTFGTRWGQ